MSHTNLIIDADPHFSIDPITRRIKNESSKKVTLIQGDHNSERFTFDMPRYIEEHDMLECDRVEVHFLNAGKGGESNPGVYNVADMQVHPEDETMVAFTWLLSDETTKYVGSLAFLIRFCCTETDGVAEYIWHTSKNTDISISEGMNNGEAVVERFPDFIESLKKEITAGLTAHRNNEDEETAHIRNKWAAAIEILFEALSTAAENTKNTISPGGFAVGYNNDVNKCSLAVGLQNIITGYRSFGAGQGLNAFGESNRAYFGQFNAKNGQAVLVVGWGTSDSNRKNVFTVDKNGKGVFATEVFAGGQRLANVAELTAMETNFNEQIMNFVSAVGSIQDSVDTQQRQIGVLQDKVKALEEIIDGMTAELH
jgi:hypothetical protein